MKITDLVSHYYCEDTWYSCPLAEDGTARDNVTECDCGYETKLKRIKEWALEIAQEALSQTKESEDHQEMFVKIKELVEESTN